MKPVGVELFEHGKTPLGSSNVTAMAQDEPPVDSTAKAICCGPACQFATFHGGEPELAAPVLERLCSGGHDHGAAGDDGAATKQRNSPGEHVSGETRQPIASDP